MQAHAGESIVVVSLGACKHDSGSVRSQKEKYRHPKFRIGSGQVYSSLESAGIKAIEEPDFK